MAVAGAGSGFINLVEVAAGESHTVFLKADGTVWSVGGNSFGQLGDGSYTNRTRAVMVPNIATVQMIAGGGKRTFAIRANGTVAGWGDNTFGALAMEAAGCQRSLQNAPPVVTSKCTTFDGCFSRFFGFVLARGFSGPLRGGVRGTVVPCLVV